MDGQPLLYPAPLFVRNTFLDVVQPRSPSLDEFFEERQAFSCPASGISEPSSGCYTPGAVLKKTAAFPDVVEGVDEAASECSTADTTEPLEHQRMHTAPRAIALRLADALNQAAAVQAPPLPSIGSVGHMAGQCKPCAFFHIKGCSSGADCKFCHACGPEERQARKKEKRAYFGAVKHARKVMAAGLRVAHISEGHARE